MVHNSEHEDMSGEEWKQQMLDVCGELYDDQFALIVFGEVRPDTQPREVNAVGTVIMPDCCTPEMLITALAELMNQDIAVREILKEAVFRSIDTNLQDNICPN